MLSDCEKNILLRVARQAIETAVCCRPEPPLEEYPPSLLQNCGAFVTLHNGTELRGCIGYIESVNSLVETVRDAAVKAAMDDYRFTPAAPEELNDLSIEISVLSPLFLMRDPGEIVVGTHGLMIEYHGARGLLLPQVAPEHGWDREMFLMQTARKAGLRTDTWNNPDANIYLFTADIFREELPMDQHRVTGQGVGRT